MGFTTRIVKMKLGEILMEAGLIKEEHIKVALEKQQKTGKMLGEILVELGFVTEEDIAQAISKQFGLPFIHIENYKIARLNLDGIDGRVLFEKQMIPFEKIGKCLLVAIAGPIEPEVIHDIEKKLGVHVFVYVSTPSRVKMKLNELYPGHHVI